MPGISSGVTSRQDAGATKASAKNFPPESVKLCFANGAALQDDRTSVNVFGSGEI